ncbi:MAG TPA: hypothetical protein VLI93_08840 [Acetobacteraceae bacterium]|nr:hypothetical protein [Acetobacteraceae bacterium]
MSKFLGVALAGLAAFGCSASAMAVQQSTRIRGTIESVNGDTVAIKSYNGKTVDVMLHSKTKFASVLPSSLSDIKSGDFIGAGATGPENNLKAMEVVVFPESMRGTGEGHYAWSVPAAVANADTHGSSETSTGGPPVAGTMTNGTVAGTTPANGAPPVQGTMTNGTVATNASKAGGKEFTVSYSNGKKVQILVPPDAPVVRLAPAQQSVLMPGAKAFVVASQPSGSSELSANFVAVGKNGMMPPM